MATVIIAAAVVALIALIAWRTYLARRTIDYFWGPITRRRRARVARSIGCDQGSNCSYAGKRTHAPHGKCVVCGQWTCGKKGYIDPASGKRKIGRHCREHGILSTPKQEALRQERRKRDWASLTDPIDDSRLRLGVLPEQFPGPTRATLRAFLDSDAEQATVADIPAERLNESIAALGLTDDVYAEQRGHVTVLRRIPAA